MQLKITDIKAFLAIQWSEQLGMKDTITNVQPTLTYVYKEILEVPDLPPNSSTSAGWIQVNEWISAMSTKQLHTDYCIWVQPETFRWLHWTRSVNTDKMLVIPSDLWDYLSNIAEVECVSTVVLKKWQHTAGHTAQRRAAAVQRREGWSRIEMFGSLSRRPTLWHWLMVTPSSLFCLDS